MFSNIFNFFFFGILLLFISLNARSQGNIGTERPTFSTSSHTIPLNSFQFEQGMIFWNDTIIFDGLFRAAVSKRAEIRLFTAYADNTTLWGAKVNLWQQEEYRPGISIQASFGNLSKLANFRISWDQKISKNLGATINVGKANNYFAILALGYSINDKLGAYIEGFYDNNYQLLDAGFTFLLNSETQFDLSGGLDISDNAYISVGFARRFLYKSTPK